MTMKPWREVAIPHEDVHRGTFVRAEFAADITRVHDGSATPEYQDPVLFFQRTFITEGMGALLTSVAKRLAGKGGKALDGQFNARRAPLFSGAAAKTPPGSPAWRAAAR